MNKRHYAQYAICTKCIMHNMQYAQYAIWTVNLEFLELLYAAKKKLSMVIQISPLDPLILRAMTGIENQEDL